MNNNNLNTTQNGFDEQSKAQSQPRITVESSVQIQKKVKKAKDAFRTISEVADKLDVQQHVLRFWETKFSQVRPLKRGGGRRYYRPEDVALLTRIHHLLYTEGYTIKGVQKLMKEQGKAGMIAAAQNNQVAVPAAPKVSASKSMTNQNRAVLEVMLQELKAMRAMIKV